MAMSGSSKMTVSSTTTKGISETKKQKTKKKKKQKSKLETLKQKSIFKKFAYHPRSITNFKKYLKNSYPTGSRKHK